MRNLLICLLCTLISTTFGQSNFNGSNKSLTKDQVQEDLVFLKKELETHHIGLYRYVSKDSLELWFDEFMNSTETTISTIDFYNSLVGINTIIKNGHTKFKPSEEFMTSLDSLPRFPFNIYWKSDSLFVLTNNSSNESIKEGSFIKSINGEDASILCREFVNKIERDGYNITYPKAMLNRYFIDYYSWFRGTPNSYDIVVVDDENNQVKHVVEGLPYNEIIKNRKVRSHDRHRKFGEKFLLWKEPGDLEFEIRNNIALMTIRTFYEPAMVTNPEKFFKNSFKGIKNANIENLIIDLRYNIGGADHLGQGLFSYLYGKPHLFYLSQTSYSPPYGKYVQEGNIYKKVPRKKTSKYAETIPSEPQFDGKVYVLMDGLSFSATGQLIGQLKNTDRAVFIGEESGGNPKEFVGGRLKFINLPNSKINVQIPLELIEMNGEFQQSDHGVIPDYSIQPDIQDIIESRDVIMDFTIDLINEK